MWSDGSAAPNPGRGAWASIVSYGHFEYQLSGTEDATTNNRMEMTGALQGIKKALFVGADEIEIVSDSQYLINGMVKRIELFTSYPNYARIQTPNSDLWYDLVDTVLDITTTWIWCKGHATNRNNNKVDLVCRTLLRKEKPWPASSSPPLSPLS